MDNIIQFYLLDEHTTKMKRFGPMRNLWEGGGQGENIIGTLKPLWYGFRKIGM
jgi:hypothetical protein